MKKIFLLFIIFLFCFSSLASASIVGNPKTVGKGKFDVSVDGEYVFNRNLKAEAWEFNKTLIDLAAPDVNYNLNNDVTKPSIKRMYRQDVEATYGLLDNLDFSVNLGNTGGKRIEGTYSGSGLINVPSLGVINQPMTAYEGNLIYRANSGFTSGAGLKGAYDLKGGWTIGLEARYSYEENKYEAVNTCLMDIPSLGVAASPMVERYQGKITVQEWYLAPYIAKTIANFTPYVGVAYTQMFMRDKSKVPDNYMYSVGATQVDISPAGYNLKYINQNVFSPFIGLNYSIGKRWDVNVEGRFLDETAVSLRGSYKF